MTASSSEKTELTDGSALDLELLRSLNEKAAKLAWLEGKLDLFLRTYLGCGPEELYVTANAVPDIVIDITIPMLIAGGKWRERAKEWRKDLKRE